MINIECPSCQSKLAIKEMYSGKVVLCPKCKGKMRIPHLDAEVEEEAPEQRVSTSRAESPRPHKRVEDYSERTPAPPKRRPVDDDDDDDDRPRRRRDEDEDLALDDEPPRPRKRKKKRRRRRQESSFSMGDVDWNLWILIGLGVVALIGFGSLAGAFAFPPLLLIPICLGGLMMAVGSIWVLIIAFMDDAMQGILCLLIGIYRLYYCIVNFDEVKVPFLMELCGLVMIIGAICAGGGVFKGH